MRLLPFAAAAGRGA